MKHRLTNPEIISALATSGHGSKVLIADSNYPISTKTGENAKRVFLNFTPGIPSTTDVLRVILDTIEIEAAYIMKTDDSIEPAIFKEFSDVLTDKINIEKLSRTEFYHTVCSRDTCLVIQTGEQRLYGNLLLTIGAITKNL